MLEHKQDLAPDQVRTILLATGKDLGPKGYDSLFGAGHADAYGVLMAEDSPLAQAVVPLRVSRASTGVR